MLKPMCLVVGLLLVAACATTKKYEAMLTTWVGKPDSALLQSWGPPDSVYENSGVQYLTYFKSRSGYVPGIAPSYQTTFIGNTAYTSAVGGSPGYAFSKKCKTTFAVTGGFIQNWRYEGNACKSKFTQARAEKLERKRLKRQRKQLERQQKQLERQRMAQEKLQQR